METTTTTTAANLTPGMHVVSVIGAGPMISEVVEFGGLITFSTINGGRRTLAATEQVEVVNFHSNPLGDTTIWNGWAHANSERHDDLGCYSGPACTDPECRYTYEEEVMTYTWHPYDNGSGYGTLLEAERSGVGTFAEGFLVVSNGITLNDARARFGLVIDAGRDIPLTIDTLP